jgi:FMN phosphatase YigB (HAD superfamily)
VANLAPATTFFIDDSPKNIEVARKFGLQAVHHQDWNSTSQKLKLNGLISC